ncbi:MAG: hypothetical protein M0R48_01125 [Candidatus Omnitrophica bacterium]|jgi:hypothetical protein|nr:hypothetical protein [Candidatus Omnitrophota bacterium]
MGKKIKYSAVVIFISFFVMLVVTENIALCRSNTSEMTSEPRMVYPTGYQVTITGDYLEFKWWRAGAEVRSYEFSLYKGGGPFGDIIVQKTLPFNASSIQVEAKLFDDNQTYTWTLRQVSNDGQKSYKSFNTFKVSKR